MEELLKEIEKDKRVTLKFNIDEVVCLKCIPDKVNQILIHCHGIGVNRLNAIRYYKPLLDNNIGIISFDLPCHGDSKLDMNDFNLTNSISHLDKVFNYVSKEYPDKKISILSHSYGAYVTLNKIKKENKFHKVFLLSSAVNFVNASFNKLNIDSSYFDSNEYIDTFLNIRIYKNSFLEFMKNDLMKDFKKLKNNIYFIHGDEDRTTLLEDVVKFSTKYDIPLKIEKGARHSFKRFDNEVIDFILKEI